MAAVVSGGSLGLLQSSLAQLGSAGQIGVATHGRAGERVYLNAATGNLVLQGQDEILIGRGPDAALLRTYNSQALLDGDNGDNWRLGFYRHVHTLAGTVNTAGSTIMRTDADGADALYTYNAALGKYVTTAGAGAFDTLSYNSTTQAWTWTDGDTAVTESYDGANNGRLTAVSDPSGNALTFTYNAGGLLSAVQTASGEITYLDYTGVNLARLRTVTSAAVTIVRTSYAYDASNRLLSVTTDLTPENSADAKTYVTSYTYDGTSKRVASMTQSDGTSLAFAYALVGSDYRVTQITDALGQVTRFAYDTAARTTTVIDPLGLATVLAYDAAGQLTHITGPALGGAPQVVSYAYDASGNVTQVTDGRGNVVIYQYDANGNRTLERDAAGNTVERVFGAKNELLAETTYSTVKTTVASSTGETWTLADKARIEGTPPALVLPGLNGSYAATPDSAAASITGDIDIRVKVAMNDWTSGGNSALVSKELEPNRSYWLRAQSDGKLALVWTPTGSGTTALTRTSTAAVAAADGAAKWVRATLDVDNGLAGHDVKFYVSDDGVTWTQLGATVTSAGTTSIFDGTASVLVGARNGGLNEPLAGRIYYAEIRNGIDGAVAAKFDPSVGVTTQPIAPLTTRYVYDAANRLRFAVSAEGRVSEFRYNGFGQQVAAIQYTGARYNVAGLAPSASLTESQLNAWLPADKSGSMRGDTTYDFRGQVDTVTTYKAVNAAGNGILDGTQAVTRYVYDQAGSLLKTIDPRGNATADPNDYTTSYLYDGFGRVFSSTDALGVVTLTQYDDANRKTVVTLANGLATTSTYDAAGRLTSVLQSANSLGLGETKYFYDTDGRLRRTEDPTGVKTHFLYDEASRNVAEIDGDGSLTEYVYDANNQVIKTIGYATAVSDSSLASLVDAQGKPTNVSLAAIRPTGQGTAPASGTGLLGEYYDNATFQLRMSRVDPTVDFNWASGAPDPLLATDNFFVRWSGQVEARYSETYTFHTNSNDGVRLWVNGVLLIDNWTAHSATENSGSIALVAGQKYDIRMEYYEGVGTAVASLSWSSASQAKQIIPASQLYPAPGNQVSWNIYNEANQLVKSIDEAGFVTQRFYDGAGQLTDVVRFTNAVNTSALPAAPRAQDVNPASHAGDRLTRNFYDADGKLAGTLDGEGFLVRFNYDAAGRLVETVRHATATNASLRTQGTLAQLIPATSAADIHTYNFYNARGQLARSLDAEDYLTEYVYDVAGNQTQAIRYATKVAARALDLPGKSGSFASTPDSPANSVTGDIEFVVKVAPESWTAGTQHIIAKRGDNNQSYALRLASTGQLELLKGSGTASTSNRSAVPTVADGQAKWFKVRIDVDNGAGASVANFWQSDDGVNWTALGPAAGMGAAGPIFDGTARLEIGSAFGGTDRVFKGKIYYADVRNGINGPIVAKFDPSGASSSSATSFTSSTGETWTIAGSANLEPVLVGNPVTSAQDQVTSFTYDALNQLVSQSNPEGTVTQYVYDQVGNLIKTVKAAGTAELRTLTAQYDKQGRLTAELSAKGAALLTGSETQAQIDAIWAQYAVRHTYDAASRRTSTTDALGNRTVFYYDADGHVTYTINALGEVQQAVYDALGQVVKTVQYGNRMTAGTAASLPGGLTDSTVNAAVAAIADSLRDRVVNYRYDVRGNLAQTRDPLGITESAAYDAFGAIAARSQQIAAGETLDHVYSYDRRGLLTKTVWDPAGLNTSGLTQYDAFGRAIRTTDASGNVRTITYDRRGQVVTTLDPLNAARTATYDAFGRVLTQTDAFGYTTRYAYDTANRSVTVTTPEGVVTTAVLNRHGEKISVSDGAGNTTTYQYDKNGNLDQTDAPGVGLTTGTYDRGDRLIATQDARGVSTTYAYDAAGRVLTRVVDPGGLALKTTYAYDAKGQAVSVVDANGVETRTAYDLKGQAVSTIVDPNGLRLETRYAYDGRGRKLTVTEAAGSPQSRVTQYAYDKLGRLLSERFDPAGLNITTTYAYDKNDNVVSKTDAAGVVTRYVYDANDRLAYTIDGLGGVTRVEYDAEGRVSRFTAYAAPISLAGLPATPGLADVAARVSASAADQTKSYVYDKDGRELFCIDALGGVTHKTYDGNGNVVRKTVYATPIPLATPLTAADVQTALGSSPSGETTRFIYDGANRLIYAIDASGAVTRTNYDGNGNVLRTRAYANTVNLPGVVSRAQLEAALEQSSSDREARYVYDAANRQVYAIDAENYVKETRYDNLGRITQTVEYPDRIAVGHFPTITEVAAALSAAAGTGTVSGTYANETVYTGEFTEPLVQPYAFIAAARADTATPTGQAVTISVSNGTEFQSSSIANQSYFRSGASIVATSGLSVNPGFVPFGDATPTQVRATVYRISDGAMVAQTYTDVGFASTESWSVVTSTDEFGNPDRWRTAVGTRWNNVNNWGGQVNLTSGTLAAGHYRVVLETWDSAQAPQAENGFYDYVDGTWYYTNTLSDVVIGTIAQPTLLSWAASTQPQGTASASFEYRAAGSTGAYSTAAITTSGTNQQVSLSGLANGNYEYRIQYKDSYGRLLKSSSGAFTSTQGGASSVAATFTYTAYGSSAAAGSSIRYFAQASDWAPIDHINATVKDRFGNVVSTAVTYPEAEANYNGEVNLKVGSALADGRYTVELTIYNKNGTTTTVAPILYELGTQLHSTRTTTVKWSAATQPAGTTVEFAYRRAGQTGETLVTPTLVNGSYQATFTYTNAGGIESGLADGIYDYAVRYKQGAAVVSQAQGQFAAAAGEHGAFTLKFAATPSASTERVNTFAYDRAGRLIQSTDPLGYSESYGYDALGNKTSFTNKKGAVWTYGYDLAGRMVDEFNPAVTVTSSDGVVEGAVSLRTRLQYDALGNLLARTEAFGRPEARTTSYQYDALGRQVRTTFPSVGVYDPMLDVAANNAGTVVNRTETVTTPYSEVVYDTLGRAVVNRAVDGTYAYKVYDAAGRLLYDIDAERFVTEYRYDAFGNQKVLIRYASRLNFGAHAAGTAWTNAEVAAGVTASAADRRIDQVFDASNRAVEVREPQAYVYDALNNQAAMAQGQTLNEYDAFGQLVRQRALHGVDGSGAPTSWADTYFYYDARGSRVAQIDPEGYLSEWQYDAAQSVTREVQYAKRAAAWAIGDYTAPPAGDAASGFDRTVAYAYDLAGRKTAQTRVGVHFSQLSGDRRVVDLTGDVTTTFGYDAVGNLVSTTDAEGATAYSYFDALGRIYAVVSPARQLTHAERGGAVVTPLTTFGLNAFGNAVRQTNHANGAAAASAAEFTAGAASGADQVTIQRFDAHGHVFQSTDAEGSSKYFSYDAAGRLAKSWQPLTERDLAGNVVATQNTIQTFQYDALGNHLATIDSSTRRNHLDPAYPAMGNYGVSVGAGIAQSAAHWQTERYDEFGTLIGWKDHFQPNNSVNVNWGLNLASLGGGDVYVQIGYNYASGGSTERGFWLGGGTTTGATLSWADAHWTQPYGVSGVYRVHIYKKNTDGNLVLIHDTNAHGWSSTLVGWQAPTQGNNVSIVHRANAGAGWTPASMHNFGAVWLADLREAGATEFEARHVSTGVEYAYQRGTVSGSAIAASTLIHEERVAYNAFGEIVSKSLDGTPTEYFDYDNAGHLWRTNKEGVDTVYLFDARGQMSAQIRSIDADLRAYADAPAVDAATRAIASAVRTEIQRDKLGRVVASELPAVAPANPSVVHAPQVVSANVSASVSNDGSWHIDEFGGLIHYHGFDHVHASWSSLAGWGAGDVRVDAEVMTTHNGPKTISQSVGSAATQGATVSLRDEIASVTRVRVFKQDVSGTYVLVADSAINNSRRLTIASPSSQAADITVFRYAPSGTTSWTEVTAKKFGPVSVVDTLGVPDGNYNYEVQYRHADGTVYATGAGSLVLSGTSATLTPSSNVETVVPVIQQTVDRWGNTLSVIDARYATDPTANEVEKREKWETKYRYNEQDQLLVEVGPRIFVQDENGNLRALRPETRNFYDRLGRAIGVQDANTSDADANPNDNIHDFVATAMYNAGGQLVRQVRPEGGIVDFAYDALGRLTGEWDARNYFTARAYDRNNRLTQVTQPDGTAQLYRYDERGNRTAERDGRGYWTTYGYDADGRAIRRSLPNGQSTWTFYDQVGRKTREINANNEAQSWQYDGANRVTSYVDLSGTGTSYTYNRLGLTKSASSWRSNDTYVYEANGALKRIDNNALSPDQTAWWSQSTEYRYDIAGNRVQEKFTRLGTVFQDAQISYDAMNRVVGVNDTRYQIAYTYDANGNRRHASTGFFNNAGVFTPKDYWYKYDRENHIVLSQGVMGAAGIEVGSQGTALAYDKAGNRTWASGASTGGAAEVYHYDGNGRLYQTDRNGGMVSYRYYDGAGNIYQRNTYDGAGTLTSYQVNTYDANGWLTQQINYVRVAHTDRGGNFYLTYSPNSVVNYTGRLGTGQVASYHVGVYDPKYNDFSFSDESGFHPDVQFNGGGWQYTNFYSYEYARFGENYQEAKINGSSTYFQPGNTTTRYDGNGNIFDVNDAFSGTAYRSFVTDRAGHILQKAQNGQTEYYFYADGKPLGATGAGGVADFDFNYTPVSDQYPSSTPSSYVVNAGDTLRGIAQVVYGDGSLWYLIADANGLSAGAPLTAGMSLTIPNKITNLHNTAETFKPYDPTKIIGDTTPTLPDPPPPDDDDGCGGLGGILVMVIVIVVAAITQQYWLLTMEGVFGVGSTAAAIAAAAATAVTANIAGQFVGMATGVQEKFDWGAVAVAAISAGITQGIMGPAPTPGFNAATAARAAVGSVVSQGVNIVAGRQEKFSWRAVAASAIFAPVAAGISNEIIGTEPTLNGELESNLTAADYEDMYAFGRTPQAGFIQDRNAGFTTRLVGNLAGNLAGSTARAVLTGGKVNYAEVAADAFGNVLGYAMVDQMQKQAQQRQRLAQAVYEAQDRDDAELGADGRARLAADDGEVPAARPRASSFAEDMQMRKAAMGLRNAVYREGIDDGELVRVYKFDEHKSLADDAAGEVFKGDNKLSGRELGALRNGSIWPDAPSADPNSAPDMDSFLGMFGRRYLGMSVDENSLVYRSHFGDLQYWHSMSPSSSMTNMDVRERVIGQLLEWYEQASGARERELGLLHMGKILHTVQDSYSPSHAVRNADGEIQQFQDYGAQDERLHGRFDKVPQDARSGNDENYYYARAREASVRLLELYANGASAAEFERVLRNDFFRLQADRVDLPSGGTLERFAPKPEPRVAPREKGPFVPYIGA